MIVEIAELIFNVCKYHCGLPVTQSVYNEQQQYCTN